MAKDDPVAALGHFAGCIADDPTDPEPYRAASRALIAALGQPTALSGWAGADKHALYRRLIEQRDCPTRPLILAHEISGHLTSGNREVAKSLVREVTPVLRDLVADGPDQNTVIFLLTTRAYLGEWMSQDWVTRLHLMWFERFGSDDFTLPYSVMFNEDSFGLNRQDILDHYFGETDRISDNQHLGVAHLLFFSWLIGRDVVSDPDNADLATILESRLNTAETTLGDHQAARMLLLRHWREGSVLTGERLEALELGDAILPLAERTARTRAQLDEVSSGKAPRSMDDRTYQAFQAGWTMATLRTPALNRRQRRIRLAVSVSGQLRGYEDALATWRRTLLANVDAEFFVHSWQAVGRSNAEPFRYVLPFAGAEFPETYRRIALQMGYERVQARYPTLFNALKAGAVVEADMLKSLYGTDHVVLEDDRADRFAAFSNQAKMHYKIHAAYELARNAGEFDLHLRIRPDLAVKMMGFDWRDMAAACRAEPVLFAEAARGLHYNLLMIGDQFALGAPETMGVYADTWITHPSLAEADLAHYSEDFQGHMTLAVNTWVQGVEVRKVPLKFGQLLESRPLGSDEILAALETDSLGDQSDRQLIEAAHRDSLNTIT